MRMRAPVLLALLFAAAMACALTPARAETWPERPVKIIIPLPAGLGTDFALRLFAEKLSARWGQPVVVENRPGADAIVAVTSFVTARDDHTLLFSFAGPITINPFVHEKLPYDPVRDLVPIATAIENFFVVAVSESTGVRSLSSFIEAARANPEKFTWAATPGLPQFIFLALQKRAGLMLTQVPYRDFGPAVQDLAENRIQVAVTGASVLLPAVQNGKARLLMVTNRQRSPIAPEVPTAEEAGFPELTFEGAVGFFGNRDMPVVRRDRIANDIAAVAGDHPEISARLRAMGIVVRAGTPAQFSAAIEEQRLKVRDVVWSDKKSQ
jgi:tripartite-type tricarboxylate transporter receptor subunit TctC